MRRAHTATATAAHCSIAAMVCSSLCRPNCSTMAQPWSTALSGTSVSYRGIGTSARAGQPPPHRRDLVATASHASQRHRMLADEVLDIGYVRRNVVEVLDVFQPMRTPSLAIARQGELFGVSTIRRVVVVAENREPAAFDRQLFAEPRAEVSGRTLRDIRHVRVNLLITISGDIDHPVDQLGASGEVVLFLRSMGFQADLEMLRIIPFRGGHPAGRFDRSGADRSEEHPS